MAWPSCSHKVCIFLSGSFGLCGYKPFGCGFEQEDQREIPPNRLEKRSGSDRNAMEDFILIMAVFQKFGSFSEVWSLHAKTFSFSFPRFIE